MADTAAEILFDKPMGTGENPLSHPEENLLYWVDIRSHAVHRLDIERGAHIRYALPAEPGAMAWCRSGGMMLALRSGIVRLDTDSGKIFQVCDAPYDPSKMRFNDGRCDAAGRFWIGTLYDPRDEQTAAMYCLERGKLRKVWQEGTTVSNGVAFSTDAGTFYHSDTTSHTIWRRDYDCATGQAGVAKVFKTFSTVKDAHYGGRPDGAVVDAEGNYWCAMFEGARLLRFSPAGEVLAEIPLPVRCPTMPAFGGKDLKTLFVTSASGGRDEEELKRYPASGCVLALTVGVAGVQEPGYRE